MKPTKLQMQMTRGRITLAIATARLAGQLDRAEGKRPHLRDDMREAVLQLRAAIWGLQALR